MSDPEFGLDRRAVMRSFARAAAHYEDSARLQREVRTDLLERLQFFTLDPGVVLDLGAGTCQASLALQRRFPRARVLALDLTEPMLRAAPKARWSWRSSSVRLRVCADAGALPLCSHSVDLIYSNLMLHWCDQPGRVFGELARVIKPGGLLLFSTFGPDTLQELRAAWTAADDGRHVSVFPDMPQLGESLMRAGFAEPVLDVEHHRLNYPDVAALMRELTHWGARNAMHSRSRGLTSRSRFTAMIEAYERQRTSAGLPATFEVIAGAAFGGNAPAPSPPAGQREVAVPLSAIRRK